MTELSMRITKKRKKILDLLKKTKKPLSTSEVRSAIGDIDLVTVYRNLELFVKEGMVQTVQADRETLKYEYTGEHKHHHAVCESCHEIYHIRIAPEALKSFIPKHLTGAYEVTIRGRCTPAG